MKRVYYLLLVDDDEAKRLVLTRRLEQAGFMVAVAEHGRAALDMLRVERFDLVLLDMYMPVMDGLATLDAIKSDPLFQETIVVMLTAANTRDHVVHCLSLGAADYLIKPVNPEELNQRVRRCLETRAPRIEPTVRVQAADMGGGRVLVVDDEPLNLKLLERRLKQLGFRALAVQRGRDALELLAREPVDAVLLDVNMPEVGGLDVLRSIREVARWRFLPVLMLSADGEDDTVSRAYQLGATDYLVKPYHLHDLRLRLAVALDIGAAHRADAGEGEQIV